MDEIRVVAHYAAESAEGVLPVFEGARPEDLRPRAAVEAARVFAAGAPRTYAQRITAMDAHRAAKDTSDEAAQHAALAAGDAAAAAYLHPLAQATQVGHILRAAAHAARVSELRANGDPDVGAASIRLARDRAAPVLIEVLRRYPRRSSRSRTGRAAHAEPRRVPASVTDPAARGEAAAGCAVPCRHYASELCACSLGCGADAGVLRLPRGSHQMSMSALAAVLNA